MRRGELSESGRGLEFMRVLMDEVDLRPGNERHAHALRQAAPASLVDLQRALHAELGVVADRADELVVAALDA